VLPPSRLEGWYDVDERRFSRKLQLICPSRLAFDCIMMRAWYAPLCTLGREGKGGWEGGEGWWRRRGTIKCSVGRRRKVVGAEESREEEEESQS